VQTQTFVMHYNAGFGYSLSQGFALAGGRELQTDWVLLAGGAYHRTTQPLVVFGREQNARMDWHQCFLTAQKYWRLDSQKRWAFFIEARAGLVFLRPHDLQIVGGAFGTITLRSKSATKFSPALGVGVHMRVCPRWAVFCYVKNHMISWAERRIETATTQKIWRSYRQIGAGLSFSF